MTALQTALFEGVSPQDFDRLQPLIRQKHYQQGQIILHAGQANPPLGLVLSGQVHIEMSDPWGGRSILGSVGQGEIFAESYALCARPLQVDAVCAGDAHILLMDAARALQAAPRLCQNLLAICAAKNLALSRRIFCTSAPTVRARVITYLSTAGRQGDSLVLPFNRQQLADYLNVDRSALSRELGRMRDDGLLTFHKNRFRLLRSCDMLSSERKGDP